MAFSDWIASGGDGRLNLRLEIEGWPHQYVTHSALEGTGSDSREWIAALDPKHSIALVENLVIQEGIARVSPATFLLNETEDLELTAVFSYEPKVLGWLIADANATTTGPSIVAAPTISTGDVVHMGTEALLKNASTYTRQYWSTRPQSHYIGDLAAGYLVPVFDHPPTLRNRRYYLYAYTDDELLTGVDTTGTEIWRGRLLRPPRLVRDKQWQVQGASMLAGTKQSVAADLTSPLRVRGRYYPWDSPFVVRISEHTGASPGSSVSTAIAVVTGHFETDADLIAALNTAIASAISAASLTTTRIRVGPGHDGGIVGMVETPASSPLYITMEINSPIDGSNIGDTTLYLEPEGLTPIATVTTSTTYYAVPRANEPSAYRLVGARGTFGIRTRGSIPSGVDPAAVASAPNTRIYLSSTDGLAVGDAVLLEGPASGGYGTPVTDPEASYERVETIDTVNTTDNYIDCAASSSGNPIVIGDFTDISVGREYVAEGNLQDFRNAVVTAAPSANAGGTAHMDASDMDAFSAVTEAVRGRRFGAARRWVFHKSKTLEEVLVEDARIIGGAIVLSSAGKVDFAELRIRAASELDIIDLTANEILQPSDAVPFFDWEPEADGIVNEIPVNWGYDAREDKHAEVPYTIRDGTSISIFKTRQGLEVAPLSRETTGDMTPDEATLCAEGLLFFLGYESRYVRVPVDWQVFQTALLLKTAAITEPNVPNAGGTRGLSSKLGIIVGREWRLPGFGLVTVLLHRDDVAGYAPAARVTGATDNGGNEWQLTVTQNFYAPSSDDDVDYFLASDFVTVRQFNDATPNEQTGTISSVDDATHVTVQFDGAAPWGGAFAGVYDLLFQADATTNTPTTHQAKYVYIADTGVVLYDGSAARILVP